MAARLEGGGRDQSRTWWDIVVVLGDGRQSERFWVRISVASGRSVRRIVRGFGRAWESVMPTMPQPAPSSRMLRPGCESVVSSSWRRGNVFRDDVELERWGRDAMYDDKTSPASLISNVN